MAEKKKVYVLLGGKHITTDKDGDEVILVKGDKLKLTDKEAKGLAGKIALVGEVDDDGDAEPAEKPLKDKENEGAGKENSASSSIPTPGSAAAAPKPAATK